MCQHIEKCIIESTIEIKACLTRNKSFMFCFKTLTSILHMDKFSTVSKIILTQNQIKARFLSDAFCRLKMLDVVRYFLVFFQKSINQQLKCVLLKISLKFCFPSKIVIRIHYQQIISFDLMGLIRERKTITCYFS